MVTAAQSAEDNEAEAIAEKRAQEFAEKLRGNMGHMRLPVEETKEIDIKVDNAKEKEVTMFNVREIVSDENVSVRRKAVLILFILACIVYVVTAIIYNFI